MSKKDGRRVRRRCPRYYSGGSIWPCSSEFARATGVGRMKPRSTLAEALPRSGIREVMDLARQMDDVIILVVGEPSFNTPAHIIDAAAKAAHAGTTKYTPNAGLPGIRAAVAERYTRKFGRAIAPAEGLA